jgi:RNA polymerase-binding transcription factor DksA
MNKTTVMKLKQRLVAEERYLAQELDVYAAGQQFISQSASEEHASSVDDAGAEMFEHEKALAIEGALEDILADVEHALHKVDDESYGVCDACGQPIDSARLQALPQASLCMACKTCQEHAGHGSTPTVPARG